MKKGQLKVNDEMKGKLHPDHLKDLLKSGLDAETISTAGIYSVCPTDIPRLLGFNPQKVESALCFPYLSNNGFSRLKVFPDFFDNNGHKVKYLQRKGSGVHLYCPPSVIKRLNNENEDLYITEGEKKALKAAQEGLCCVGLGGIWNWKTSNSDEPIPEIKNIRLLDRKVYLVPDSDFTTNKNVLLAVYRFGLELEKLGATVEVVCIPEIFEKEKK